MIEAHFGYPKGILAGMTFNGRAKFISYVWIVQKVLTNPDEAFIAT